MQFYISQACDCHAFISLYDVISYDNLCAFLKLLKIGLAWKLGQLQKWNLETLKDAMSVSFR